jgi:Undecaprenyl-phosphate glucose phosphotransferase
VRQVTNTSARALIGQPPLTTAAKASLQTKISDEIFVGLVAIGDVLAITAASAAAFTIYWYFIADDASPDPLRYVLATVLAAGLTVHRLAAHRVYNLIALQNAKRQATLVLAAWTTALVVLIVLGFLLKISSEFSRIWLVSWYLASGVLLMSIRFYAARVLRQLTSAGKYFCAVVVVGGGELGQRFVQWVAANPASGLHVVGIFDDRAHRIPASTHGVPLLGSVNDLIEHGRRSWVDMIVIALPLSAEQRILSLARTLRMLPVDIRLLNDSIGFQLHRYAVSYPAGIPTINIADRPIGGWNLVAKRVLDIALASLALLALTPLLATIAALIRLDSPGSIIFRQRRFGFNNCIFSIYKFRTMRVEAADERAERLVSRNDARVTRIGRYLRRWSLDELPQLWNVLNGDMSLVGPRPHPLRAKAADTPYDEVVAEYALRHRVKPGITGWAQVNGWRGETDTIEKIQRRVQHDLYYIDNWSIVFDVWILILTLVKGVTGRNAY